MRARRRQAPCCSAPHGENPSPLSQPHLADVTSGKPYGLDSCEEVCMIKSYASRRLEHNFGAQVMRNTQPLTVTLPHEMAAMVKAKVASGEYATESEVVRDGLRALQARDAALEAWLRGEVARSYDDFAADPSIGIPADQMIGRLRASYRKRLPKTAD